MTQEATQAIKTGKSTITGGQLVARALNAEGIKAIFTLSGGHIVDIYNGCADEGIASSMYATSRPPRTPQTPGRA